MQIQKIRRSLKTSNSQRRKEEDDLTQEAHMGLDTMEEEEDIISEDQEDPVNTIIKHYKGSIFLTYY